MLGRLACLQLFRLSRARASCALSAVLLSVALSGCGGGGGGVTAPTPAYEQTINGNVIIFGFNQHSLTAPRAGQMRAVLNWANGTIDLDLYLTDSTCDSYPVLHCTLLATSAASFGTAETINRQVTSGQAFKVWVDNFSDTLPSDYSIRVTIE
jgi:hypothetical protein